MAAQTLWSAAIHRRFGSDTALRRQYRANKSGDESLHSKVVDSTSSPPDRVPNHGATVADIEREKGEDTDMV